MPVFNATNAITGAAKVPVLKDNISLKMYIKGAGEGMYAKVWFNKNYDGSKVEKTVPFAEFVKYGSDYHYVSVDELAVADGFQLVTCEIYDAEGNLLDSGADSVASYLKAMADYYTDEPLWMDTLKFIASAKATVATQG